MSFSDVVARMTELQALAQRGLEPVARLQAASSSRGRLQFQDVLAESLSPPPLTTSVREPPGTPGVRVLAAAEGELGVAEAIPGSNDGPRIAEYRSAVSGAYAGAPWCAYFVSWVAAQAGAPLGDTGEGFGAVEEIAAWAQRTGRLLPPGEAPSPGDLILFGGRHVGIVESVNPDGSLTTIEGNEGDAVRRVTRSSGEATGFVRL
jgi:hypothetical protein